jgi:hypothetical protein
MILLLGPQAARADVETDPEKDVVAWRLAVTSYYMFNAHRVAGPYNELEYPYADSQGFGLTFVSAGVAYQTSKWGVLIELKWGQNVDRLTELTPVSRAFARWIPVSRDRLKLDLGYFGAFVGIETDNEWENPTFTRGIIYFRMQPFRHLGFRAIAQLHEDVDLVFVVANGSIFGTQYPENVRSGVLAPALGAQLVYTPSDTVDIKLGSVTSPNGSNGNRDWQAIVDFITQWKPGPGNLFIDADYQLSGRGTLTNLPVSRQWGVSVGGGYDITDNWSVGLRAEYFGASDGTDTGYIFTFTGSVRYSPVQYLVITLEPRGELADSDVYFGRPLLSDPVTGVLTPSLNQRWFFGFWLGVTARIGN